MQQLRSIKIQHSIPIQISFVQRVDRNTDYHYYRKIINILLCNFNNSMFSLFNINSMFRLEIDPTAT